MWTEGGAWVSTEQGKKGRIAPGQLADFAALDQDYFSVPDEEIKTIVSVLTVVGGRIVHGDREFKDLAPPLPPAMPEWSPVRTYGGYRRAALAASHAPGCSVHPHVRAAVRTAPVRSEDASGFWEALGCECFAF